MSIVGSNFQDNSIFPISCLKFCFSFPHWGQIWNRLSYLNEARYSFISVFQVVSILARNLAFLAQIRVGSEIWCDIYKQRSTISLLFKESNAFSRSMKATIRDHSSAHGISVAAAASQRDWKIGIFCLLLSYGKILLHSRNFQGCLLWNIFFTRVKFHLGLSLTIEQCVLCFLIRLIP